MINHYLWINYVEVVRLTYLLGRGDVHGKVAFKDDIIDSSLQRLIQLLAVTVMVKKMLNQIKIIKEIKLWGKKKIRSQQDSNLRGQSPMDF